MTSTQVDIEVFTNLYGDLYGHVSRSLVYHVTPKKRDTEKRTRLDLLILTPPHQLTLQPTTPIRSRNSDKSNTCTITTETNTLEKQVQPQLCNSTSDSTTTVNESTSVDTAAAGVASCPQASAQTCTVPRCEVTSRIEEHIQPQ